MKKILPVVIGLYLANASYGQEMPSVFNKSLSLNSDQLEKVEPLSNGDLMIIGGGSKSYFARLSADGKTVFERKGDGKDAAMSYNDMVITSDGSALVVGGGNRVNGAGRISLFNNKGILIFDKVFGKNSGGYFTKVKQDRAGNFVTVGIDGSSPSRARITKISIKGDILFDKLFRESTVFSDLLIDDDDSFIAIGGDVGDSRGHGLLVKLTSTGDKVYEINSGNGGYSYTQGTLMDDGSLLAIGGGIYGTGNPCRATRVRVDGQVIFDKTYSTVDSKFTSMGIDSQGYILLSSEEFDRGRIIKLRPDGTIVFNKETTSPILDLKVNSVNQTIAIGSKNNSYELLKLSVDGKVLFDVPSTGTSLKKLLLSEDGKIYTTSDKSCRILKFDDITGDLIFDKEYGKMNGESSFVAIANLPSGEIVAIGNNAGPWNYFWKDSHGNSIKTTLNKATADTLNGLWSGSYQLIVTTVGGCDNNQSNYSIIQKNRPYASFSCIDTCYIDQDPIVLFNNTTPNSTSQSWDFGDSNSSTVFAPQHHYQAIGNYIVTLAASSSNGCIDTVTRNIVVANKPVGINTVANSNSQLTIKTLGNDQFLIQQKFNTVQNVSYSVQDISGRSVINEKALATDDLKLDLDLGNHENGVYFVSLKINNVTTVIKLIAKD